MNELRKIEKVVNKYVKLLAKNTENAKMYSADYAKDVEYLQEILENYFNYTSEIFQKWCNISVEVFNYEDINIFQKVKKKIDMLVVNHYLSRFSYDLSKANILKEKLCTVKERFMQYSCLT